jgi:hypothetical protein
MQPQKTPDTFTKIIRQKWSLAFKVMPVIILVAVLQNIKQRKRDAGNH